MKLSDGFTKICFSVGTLISYALLLPLAFPSRNFFSFSRQWSQSIYSSLQKITLLVTITFYKNSTFLENGLEM